MDDGSYVKKAKGTKTCIIKGILKFKDCKNCLQKNKIILKSQQRFKSEAHNVFNEEINKIALSSNDDKSLQAWCKFTYGASVGKVCKTGLLQYLNVNIK